MKQDGDALPAPPERARAEDVSPSVFGALLLVLLYASTPNVQTLSPKGTLDALAGVLMVLAVCRMTFVLPRGIAVPVAGVVSVGFAAYNVANGLYYGQQQTYLSAHTLYLAGETFSLIDAAPGWKRAVAAIAVLSGTVAAAWLVHRAWPSNGRSCARSAAALAAAGTIALTGHAAITNEAVFRVEDATPFGHMVRSSGYVPFVRPDEELVAKSERDALIRLIRRNAATKLPDRYSEANLMRLRGYDGASVPGRLDTGSTSTVAEPALGTAFPAEGRLNVIVLVLESVRASEMGLYGAKRTATPFLDRLGRENLWAERFYATSNFTVKSEHAIHCSTLDFMIGPPIAERDLSVNHRCLPSRLKQNGYRTLWFHGNDKEFYNRASYLPRIGFDDILSRDELDPDHVMPTLGWGLPDPVVLDLAMDRLEDESAPFYAEILTVSNHMPFDVDWGIDFPETLVDDGSMYGRYRRGMHYTDRAVARFYERFLASPLARDTLLVVTGDHGVWTFADDRVPQLVKNETFFRVPLIIRTPGGGRATFRGNASHLDVAPTIAHALGIERDGFLGRSLLDPDTANAMRATYLMTEQALSYRFPDRACLPSIQCEDGMSCSRRYGNRLPEPSCYAVDPEIDLLWDAGAAHTPIGAEPHEAANDRALFDYSQMILELDALYPMP